MEHLCRRFRFVSLLYVFLRSEFIHHVQKEAAISLVVVIYLYIYIYIRRENTPSGQIDERFLHTLLFMCF